MKNPVQRKSDYSSRFPGGKKFVAYNRDTREYINETCSGVTTDRNYAWVGSPDQYFNMMLEYGFPRTFKRYLDGDEREPLT